MIEFKSVIVMATMLCVLAIGTERMSVINMDCIFLCCKVCGEVIEISQDENVWCNTAASNGSTQTYEINVWVTVKKTPKQLKMLRLQCEYCSSTSHDIHA